MYKGNLTAANFRKALGLKPYFIEITADMLKYLPFADRAGMSFIGLTEGNLGRVQKDMNYILKNFSRVEDGSILHQEVAGIVDLQVRYAATLKALVDQGIETRTGLVKLLSFRNNHVTSLQYKLLHGVLRLPKPTYLKALTPLADQFLSKRIDELAITNHRFDVTLPTQPVSEAIRVRALTISAKSHIRDNRKTRAVHEAFGLRPQQLEYPLLSALTLGVLTPRSMTV